MTQRQGDVHGEIGNMPGPLWVCRTFARNAQVEVQGSFHLGRSKRITNNWICNPPCPCTGPIAFQCNIFNLRVRSRAGKSQKSHSLSQDYEKKKQSWCSHWNRLVAEAHGELFTARRSNGDWGLVGGWLLSRRTSAPDSFGASWPNNRTMDKYLSPNHRLWFPDGLMLGSIGRVMMLSKAKWSRGSLFFCLWYIFRAISFGDG